MKLFIPIKIHEEAVQRGKDIASRVANNPKDFYYELNYEREKTKNIKAK